MGEFHALLLPAACCLRQCVFKYDHGFYCSNKTKKLCQFVRVVKETHSKCVVLCTRRFKSCS